MREFYIPAFKSMVQILNVMTIFLLSLSRSRGFQSQNVFKMRRTRNAQSCFMTTSNTNPFLINIISSTKSNTVKKIQQLLKKPKKRSEIRQTVVEGPRIIFDLLANPRTHHLVKQILISVEDYEKEYQDKLSKLSSSSPSPDYQVQLVEPQVLKSISDTKTPQGIVALVDIPSHAIDPSSQHPLYLVLDGVSDPGNLGTLLRSCLAVGCAGVILLPECCDVWSPKAVRSSMGASFLLPFKQEESFDDALTTLKKWNVQSPRVYAATMIDGGRKGLGSEPYFNVDWLSSPSALVIGSEGNGLSPEIRKHVHKAAINAVHVPMNPGIESLNAAVCGSVILFEYSRQCTS